MEKEQLHLLGIGFHPLKTLLKSKKKRKKKETQNELRTEDFINFYKFC